MNQIEGPITLLGDATGTANYWFYTVLKVGDVVLENVGVENKLSNFLKVALHSGGNVRIYYQTSGKANRLIALVMEDGTAYGSKWYGSSPAKMMIMGTIFLPIGFGLFIWLAYLFSDGPRYRDYKATIASIPNIHVFS